MNDVKGCIVRLSHADKTVCKELEEAFKDDHRTAKVLEPTYNSRGLFTFYVEMMGNLDLEGWMSAFATELEEMRSEGILPAFGSSISLNFELVY